MSHAQCALCSHAGYSKEGFLTLQHTLDKAIMRHHAHNATAQMFQDLTVLVKRFPHGAHIQDTFLLVLQSEFPLLLTLSFLCLELIIINSVAREKEKRLKVTGPVWDASLCQDQAGRERE